MQARHQILFSLLCLLLISGAGTSISTFAQPDTSGNRGTRTQNKTSAEWGPAFALIVGISGYKNIPQLDYADDDAEAFRDFLLDTKIITDPNNIYYLIDSMATKTEIFRGLNNILTKLKGDNSERVYIYFAGHGDTESETEQGYLLAYNCEKVAYDMTDAVYLPQFEPKVAAIAKKAKVFLITDACRSGNLAGQNNGALRTMKAINDGFVNSVKILSCEPGQLSQEKHFPGGGHGVFTYFLLEALYGLGVSDSTKVVKINDVRTYISQKVFDNTKEEQSPMVLGSASEIIAKVDMEMKLAMIARKRKAAENPDNPMAKRRNMGAGVKISEDDSVYYKQFYTHLRAGRLNTPSGSNAWEIFKTSKIKIKNQELLDLMRFDLAAKLEDAVQPLLNRFIRAEFQDYPDSLFNDADNKLKIVMDYLMDSSDIRINEIKAKRIFFIASVQKTSRALELLRSADALLPNSTFISFELGRYFSEVSKQNDSALFYLNKAIQLSPRWSYPRFLIGNMYYRNKEYPRARNFYTNAIELQPKFGYALINLALTYKQLKEKDSADFYYKKALMLDKSFETLWSGERKPDDEMDIVSLGKAVRTTDRTDDKQLEGLLPPVSKTGLPDISPDADAGYTYYLKAYNYNSKGNTDSATFYYSRAAGKFEKAYNDKTLPLAYYYTWGFALHSANDNNKAVDVFKLGLQKDTVQHYLYLFAIGWILDLQKNINEALEWYRKAAADNPYNSQVYNNIGWAYGRLNNKDSAIYYYQKALQVNPDYITTLYNIGDIYYLNLVDDSAIYYYKKLSKVLTTPDADLFNRIATSYDYTGQPDSALVYFLKAIEADRNKPDYYNNAAHVYFTKKMYEKAMYNYEKAGSLSTKGVKKYINLALSYAYLSNYKKAEEILQEGIKVDTASAEKYLYYYNLGWLKNKQLKPDEAIRWYKKSIMQNPAYADAYNNLGYVYDRQGKKDSAVYWYKQCLKIVPDYTRAMYNLAYIYNDTYKYDSSLYYYKLLYRLMPRDAFVAYEIGLSYYYSYDYDSSIVYLERAITLNNKNADYYAKAGDAYFDGATDKMNKTEFYQKAIEYYSGALLLDSTLYLAMNRLGVASIYLEKYDEGARIFELALQKDAVYKNIYEYNLACISSLQKKTAPALDYFERSIKSGYTDLAHITVDTDLDNIRRLPEFKTVIQKYFKTEEINKYPGLFGKPN